MSDKIKKLGKVDPEPNQAIIEALEDVLAEAKRGKLISLVIAGETTGGHYLKVWDVNDKRCNIFALQGLLGTIKQHLIDLTIS